MFLLGSWFFFATIVWCAEATSFGSLSAARILSAFTAAVGEGLAAAISADLFFLHERGWWMGLFWIALSTGGTIGSLCAGFIIENKGWRWEFWVSVSKVNCSNERLVLYYRELMPSLFSYSSPRLNTIARHLTFPPMITLFNQLQMMLKRFPHPYNQAAWAEERRRNPSCRS